MGVLLFLFGFMLCGFILYSIFVFLALKVVRDKGIRGFHIVPWRSYGAMYDQHPAWERFKGYRYSPPSDSRAGMHKQAIDIIEIFDDFLREKGIKVPCEDENEEAERTEDNDAALYGTEYSNLVDKIENVIS